MKDGKRRPFRAEAHHRQTEGRLILGGFLIIVVIGGGLIWWIMGPVPALIGLAIVLLAGVLFGLLLLLLRALDAWARSE
ncbi:MAG: hypothetical protein M1401_20370 [Chloroflexi bacterium]|nr:hypothetical protein [Chloroflexota bacterium]